MAETNTLVDTRTADTWPKHRAKSRKRQATRTKIAREAQTRIDRVRNAR
jgi:hypothetical protein